MPNPDSITVEIVNPISSVLVSPVEEIDQVSVNTIPEVDTVTVDNTDSVSTISIAEDSQNYVVDIGFVDFTSPVQSVNGKTGHVVIDYPDISNSPVNQVKYVHIQNSISSQWEISHNLGFFPNITILDNANRVIEADIQYVNINNAKIVMNVGISGTAYLT
jgi:hypothetical protein